MLDAVRVGPDAGEPVRLFELSFTESAAPGPDGTLQVDWTITPSLEPGRYALEVTVERADGTPVTMQTSILLLERPGG